MLGKIVTFPWHDCLTVMSSCEQILTVFSETCCTHSCSDRNGKIWHFSLIFFLFPKNIQPRHKLWMLFWMRFVFGQMYNLLLWMSSDWHHSRSNSDILSLPTISIARMFLVPSTVRRMLTIWGIGKCSKSESSSNSVRRIWTNLSMMWSIVEM